MHNPLAAVLLAAALPLGACSSDDVSDERPTEQPNPGGKADADAVSLALAAATADGELDASDVDALFDAANDNVSKNEMLVIRDAVESTDFEVTDGAAARAHDRAYLANLFDYEADQLGDPANGGYGVGQVPEAVRALVAQARLNGAAAFDVRDTGDDGEGLWSPYPSTAPPVGNMAFDYTLVTPTILQADIDDTQLVYNAITGSEMAEQCDNAGNCFEFEQAAYSERTGGTGNIAAHYDEFSHHPDLFARGRSGQKWASNCAFLSDGTVHCLPAARRSVLQDLILTNPHLSRCNQVPGFEDDCHTLMYMGHITANAGVITTIEVSGRVSKRIARGRDNLIDPISLLEAWGFETRPNLRIVFGNTEDGVPQRNAERGILEEAP